MPYPFLRIFHRNLAGCGLRAGCCVVPQWIVPVRAMSESASRPGALRAHSGRRAGRRKRNSGAPGALRAHSGRRAGRRKRDLSAVGSSCSQPDPALLPLNSNGSMTMALPPLGCGWVRFQFWQKQIAALYWGGGQYRGNIKD